MQDPTPCENCTFYFLTRCQELVAKEKQYSKLKADKCDSCSPKTRSKFRRGIEKFSIARWRLSTKGE